MNGKKLELWRYIFNINMQDSRKKNKNKMIYTTNYLILNACVWGRLMRDNTFNLKTIRDTDNHFNRFFFLLKTLVSFIAAKKNIPPSIFPLFIYFRLLISTFICQLKCMSDYSFSTNLSTQCYILSRTEICCHRSLIIINSLFCY